MLKISIRAVCITGILALIWACSPSGTGSLSARKIIRKKCSVCHTTDRIFKAPRKYPEWNYIIDRMIRHGAVLDPEEEKTIRNYLIMEYGAE